MHIFYINSNENTHMTKTDPAHICVYLMNMTGSFYRNYYIYPLFQQAICVRIL